MSNKLKPIEMSNNAPTIDDMNETIAIFDGWELVKEDNERSFRKNGYWLRHNQLGYHVDWNELMRVWFKFIAVRFKKPMDQLQHSELKTTIGYAILYGQIDLAHFNIFQAIEWYNNTKNQ